MYWSNAILLEATNSRHQIARALLRNELAYEEEAESLVRDAPMSAQCQPLRSESRCLRSKTSIIDTIWCREHPIFPTSLRHVELTIGLTDEQELVDTT